MFPLYDLIIVGAGHAGCEAAAAAAKLGSQVLLITMNMSTIGQMSCNPAMGGIAKGQILREIDALGGLSGIISDQSMIQFRMLNRSKGPAMWSPRTQNDRMQFASKWRYSLEQIPNVHFWQDMVKEIIVKEGRVVGVKTAMNLEIKGKSVVLTNGTFLNGIIHIGTKQFGGGRASERAATGLTEQLASLGFEAGRMKTGTPPRVDGRTLNYAHMEAQPGDAKPGTFSFSDETEPLKTQKSCHITYTNPRVHTILADGFDQSPMFNERIQGKGPRYCPSIEDKIIRFAERDRHQIFVEPEGWDTVEVYVNGFSTSLPEEIQHKALRAISGFENAHMFRLGYAIEYDYLKATQLQPTLETRLIHNLYFAGQINGTTGYEEAACQGLVAGINAHRKVNDLEPFTLGRSDAYIGVLIDDLIHKPTDEPYRMFTSRAEFRISLRQDNADLRLTPMGHALGLASDARLDKVKMKQQQLAQIMQLFQGYKPDVARANQCLAKLDTEPIREKQSVYQLLKRPAVVGEVLYNLDETLAEYLQPYSSEAIDQAIIQIKYETYLQQEEERVHRAKRLENHTIPTHFDYKGVRGLSAEGAEKLMKLRPNTLGQAARISGVSPADVSILMVYMHRVAC
ncbi:MAG: tRNA uridine-5-carboxymethylaminomethyl(34) synthesis enzyme MnmG [Bacteroidota bacterium]